MFGSGPDAFEAGWDAMFLTWWGQLNVKGIGAEMAGVPSALRAREIDWSFNAARDGDFRGYEPYIEELIESVSAKDLAARKYQIDINNDLRHNVEDFPVTRFLAEGFIDPINLIPVPLLLGKGFWNGAKKAATINVPLVVGTEAWRIDMDPTAESSELLFSTMGSLLFSGLIGGIAGKYKPVGKMTVMDAVKILTPLDKPIPASEAGMFNFLRYMGSGMMRRIHDNLRSYDNLGGNKSDIHIPKIKVDRVVDADDLDTVRVTHDDIDGEVAIGIVRGGDTLHIQDARVPENMRNQGIGTAAYKSLIKYGQDNNLKVVSDIETSPSAMGVWEKLKGEGFNIRVNEGSEMGKNIKGDDVLLSDSSAKPNYEVMPLLDEASKKIPRSEIKNFEEYTTDLKLAKETVAKIKAHLSDLEKQLSDMPDNKGGRRKKMQDRINVVNQNLVQVEGIVRTKMSQLADTNTRMSLMLDAEVADSWNLLPTGYNTILGNIDQFPFWVLMKNKGLMEASPELARRAQLFALRMASTPGLNTEGHALGHSAGRSVEATAPVHYASFVSAKTEANRLYLKYMDLGEHTTGFNTYMVDQGQRVRGMLNVARGRAGSNVAREGKLSMKEWDNEITLAILQKGKHSIKEVAEAASHYIKWIEEIGEQARSMGLLATQKNLARKIESLKLEAKNLRKALGEKADNESYDEYLESIGSDPNSKVSAVDGDDISLNNPVLDDLEVSIMHAEDMLNAYNKAGSDVGQGGTGWIHRVWRKDDVMAKEGELKAYLTKRFTEDPSDGKVSVRIDDELVVIDMSDPDAIQARVDEAYSSILKEADHGGDADFMVRGTDKRPWLQKRRDILEARLETGTAAEKKNAALRIEIIDRKLERIRNGQPSGTSGGLISRSLDLDDKILHEMGVIEQSVTSWASHYGMRIAPQIETARIFGDGMAEKEIFGTYTAIKKEARAAWRAGDKEKARALNKEADRVRTAMKDLRDIVQGTYGIPDDPSAITGRVLRLLRNLNLVSAMGRSTLMAFGDTGNVMISQGFMNTNRQLLKHFVKGIGESGVQMMEKEVLLAGSAVEVVMNQRFHQLTELGGTVYRTGSMFNRVEVATQNMAQRFFLHNMMAPWTDMMRKVSGSMLQSRIIENAIRWRDGVMDDEQIKVMNRLGVNKTVAAQFLEEWEESGKLMHGDMFIANTEQWVSAEAKRMFRSALNTEINRMVPTPGAADKPKSLLSNEWWKMVGQYRGFSIGATHRIMAAGLQTKSADKWMGMSAMISIAMMVDSAKRPDYIKMSLEEQVLRAVELSGVTGVILDFNDSLERASAGAVGVRPTLGMPIRERDPNWATRLGTAGAVPNQMMTLLHAFLDDDSTTRHKTRALRYMIPYNNLIWWNEYINRIQRSATDYIED